MGKATEMYNEYLRRIKFYITVCDWVDNNKGQWGGVTIHVPRMILDDPNRPGVCTKKTDLWEVYAVVGTFEEFQKHLLETFANSVACQVSMVLRYTHGTQPYERPAVYEGGEWTLFLYSWFDKQAARILNPQ